MARAFLFYFILGFALGILFFRLFHRWQNKTVYLVADKILKEYAPRNTVLFFYRLGRTLPIHTSIKLIIPIGFVVSAPLKSGVNYKIVYFFAVVPRSLLTQKEQPIFNDLRLCFGRLRFHFRLSCKFAPGGRALRSLLSPGVNLANFKIKLRFTGSPTGRSVGYTSPL